jgi:hypothetical protein
MNRTFKAAALLSAVVAMTAVSAVKAQSLWTLSGGGVWDIPAGKRVTWNPATGAIGNMGTGVIFNVAAPPANVQAGAAAQAALGYTFWNALSAIPTVNIKFVAGAAANSKSTTSWGAIGPVGSTGNAAVNFDPRNITLSNTLAVRSDGWNIFNPAGPAASQQFDTFSINVHEAGHVLGLNHPGSVSQIMTSGGAVLAAGGKWDAVKQVTPFAGQPLSLNGAGVPTNALPAGTPTYFQPQTLGLGDALGAITLYSAPISAITSAFTNLGGGIGRFTYTASNDSAQGQVNGQQYTSGYDESTFEIPVDPSVPTSNLVAPSGYSITRQSSDVLVQSLSPSFNLVPGGSLQFSFDSTANFTNTLPTVDWSILGLGTDSATDPSFLNDVDDDPAATPAFNFTDFGVLDGTFTYAFNNSIGDWQTVEMADVITPTLAPEPTTLSVLMIPVAVVLGMRCVRRRRDTSSVAER